MMVGAGLAIVGASLQAVTRNPLADPHLLGIFSGGAFGAILALLHTGLFIGLLTVPLLAFLDALDALGAPGATAWCWAFHMLQTPRVQTAWYWRVSPCRSS